MKQKEILFTENAPKGRGPFPQAVRYGDLLFVSGQGPLNPESSEPETGSFESETRRTLDNLKAIVEGSGGSLSDALQIRVYLTDLANIPLFNQIYREYFSEQYAARTLIQAGLRGIQVEIDGIFGIKELE
jgi:2-iminobutanoate/2-iminopropanoate deaminase